MIVIPAVDIRGGNVVRLFRGDFSKETVYSADPVKMALKWQSEGAKRLHLVDLDGALEGKLKNLDWIRKNVYYSILFYTLRFELIYLFKKSCYFCSANICFH